MGEKCELIRVMLGKRAMTTTSDGGRIPSNIKSGRNMGKRTNGLVMGTRVAGRCAGGVNSRASYDFRCDFGIRYGSKKKESFGFGLTPCRAKRRILAMHLGASGHQDNRNVSIIV